MEYKSDSQEELIVNGALCIVDDTWARLRLRALDQHALRTILRSSAVSKQRQQTNSYVLWYQLQRQTDVLHVGHQLWGGGLLLMDFLLSNQLQLPPCAVLELGCGVGLASILAAQLGAQHVLATDVGADLLLAITTSVERNHCSDRVSVRQLDWCAHDQLQTILDNYDKPSQSAPDAKRAKGLSAKADFTLMEADLRLLLRSDNIIILAADGRIA
jgi:predicted nicotinamide N-methyase